MKSHVRRPGLDERGAGLAEELGSSPGPAGREDTRSS